MQFLIVAILKLPCRRLEPLAEESCLRETTLGGVGGKGDGLGMSFSTGLGLIEVEWTGAVVLA